jgi:UDP-N-acetylglucosamine 2-epimerase (non-hydrolysing)
MLRFEEVLLQQPFDVVVVVGDVNSTLACSIVAAKLGIPVAHVEAGLRSFDRSMPEEINRLVTDTLSAFLFTTCKDANDNLLREGISLEKIFFVGNVMVDSLLVHIERAKQSTIRRRLTLSDERYAVLTLHRPSNVDDKGTIAGLLVALREIQHDIKIIFPAHPRTIQRINEFDLNDAVRAMENLVLIEPMGYLDFLNLLMHATLVLTDSGGLQEETAVLGIPCLTLRYNTERPVTINMGTNTLVGTDPGRIVREAQGVLAGKAKSGKIPPLWDGHAAERIVKILRQEV